MQAHGGAPVSADISDKALSLLEVGMELNGRPDVTAVIRALRSQLFAAQRERDDAVRLMRAAIIGDDEEWQLGGDWHDAAKALLAAIDAAGREG